MVARLGHLGSAAQVSGTESAPFSASPVSRVRMPGLDALRGLAIALVLAHNLSVTEGGANRLFKLWNLLPEAGWVGVQIFFVLSGFLITGILADDRDRPRAYETFYLRRALRIFPLYYAMLGVYVVLRSIGTLSFPISAPRAVLHLLYLQNWAGLLPDQPPGLGHLWSLAVEEQFYLLWPLLIGCASPRGSAIGCGVVIGGAFLCRLCMRHADLAPAWLYLATPTRADALAIGGLLALGLRSTRWKPRLIGVLPWLASVSGLGLGVIVVVTHGLNRLNPLVQLYGYTLVALLAAVATARAAHQPVDGRAGVRTRGLLFLGKYSYGIYVVHLPVKVALVALLGEALRHASNRYPVGVDVLFMAAGTLISIGLAYLCWHLIEKPFLLLKDRIAAR